MRLLIVGLDPGTTAGYALLDTAGRIIKLKSSKELELKSLISEITKEGSVLVVGTDKGKCPALVERFAIKTGAVLVLPHADLTSAEKRELVKGTKGKDHELDALAAAKYAFRKIEPMIKKVDNFAIKNNKEELADKIIKLVLKNGMNIKGAVDILEEPEKEIIEEKTAEEKVFGHDDYIKLREQFKKLRNTARLLERQNKKLKKEIKKLGKKQSTLSKKLSTQTTDKKAKELIKFKEKRIESMDDDIKEKNVMIKEMEKDEKELNRILADANTNVVAKKLENLGWKEFESKNKMIDVKRGDVLLVNDASVYSRRTIDELKGKVDVIICRKVSKKMKDFTFINAGKLRIKEDKFFAVVNKKDFEAEKAKQNIVAKIVDGYKESRKGN
ncbi:MAG: DUF460 domain-containing protein [bacterium]|nr:DUF460 domain-containing protein [bacterium]